MNFKSGKNRLGERAPAIPLVVAATVTDIDSDETYYEWHYANLAGDVTRRLIPRSEAPSKIATFILDHAGKMPSDDPSKIVELVNDALARKSERFYSITRRCGWHGDSYVDWKATYGPKANSLLFDFRYAPKTGRRGTLKKWRRGLRKACGASSFLTCGLAVTYAAPLLALSAEKESWLFYLHGKRPSCEDGRMHQSTSGKSSTIRVMNSSMERAERTDLIPFAITERALGELCAKHNDRAVGLDEAARSAESTSTNKEKVAQIAYAVGSGVGKVISEKAARDLGLPNLVWRTIALCSGEPPLDAVGSAARKEGEQVRMIGIPVPPGDKGGIFDRLMAGQEAKALMDEVERTITANYGHALPQFLSTIVPMRAKLAKRLRKDVEAFCENVGALTNPWEFRFASRFGIVSAAAVIAAELNLAPWNRKHARQSVRRIYWRARKAVGSAPAAVDTLLAKLRKAKEDGKFPMVEKGASVPKAVRGIALGVRRRHPKHGVLVAIPREQLAELIKPQVFDRALSNELVAMGAIVKARDGKLTHQKQVNGFDKCRSRFVCFRLSELTKRP